MSVPIYKANSLNIGRLRAISGGFVEDSRFLFAIIWPGGGQMEP